MLNVAGDERMDTPNLGARVEGEPLAKQASAKKPAAVHAPSIVVACVVIAIATRPVRLSADSDRPADLSTGPSLPAIQLNRQSV